MADANIQTNAIITEMSQNMLIRINSNGTIDAKITRPKQYGDASTGTLRINTVLYTVASYEFVQVYPRI